MRLAWATDIHLNFVQPQEAVALCRRVRESGVEALLLGGDIAEAPTLAEWLALLDRELGLPVYFVLGNHDFYRGAIEDVRKTAASLSQRSRLRWLGSVRHVPLTSKTGLIGHDGWADARLGDYENSTVVLSDFTLISDLRGLDRGALRRRLGELGDEAADHFRRALPEALERFEHVLVLTHVPPFKESCWYDGRISDDEWLPFFTCRAVGDVLIEAMRRRADRTMTVLCGHTHGAGECAPLPNLRVRTGGATYGRPTLQAPVDVP